MRTHKKKEATKRPDVRRLKVQPKIRFNAYSRSCVPEIKLCGKWLYDLGFTEGANVTITTMPQLLIIRPIE
jgi:hypothetical protein